MTNDTARELQAEIRARGHWSLIIRPSTFVEHRIKSHSDLDAIIQNASVQVRGWDFPHINPHEPRTRDLDSISQTSSWNEFREFWCAYFSGQFFDLDALTDDWRSENTFAPPPRGFESGKSLSVFDVVYRFVEVFEFASRLASSEVGHDQMYLSVTLHGMNGRSLVLPPDRMPFREDRTTSVDTIPYETEVARAELIAKPRELAIEPSRHVFSLFGWDVPDGTIQEIQSNLWR